MRIIHFSDFHLEGDKLAEAESIVDSLITAFKDIHKGKTIDLILFSGDLINKGGEKFPDIQNGFKTFQDKVIEPILATLKLPHNRFVFTIGNHDVDTKIIDIKDETSLRKKLKNAQSVYNFMEDPDLQIPRVSEYNKFRDEYWERHAGKAEVKKTIFQYGVKLIISGRTVGVNCLNTAWRCCGSKTDRDKIILGKSQITKMKSFFEDCYITFSLGHHSISMMKDFETTTLEELVAENYAAYFCGHTHDTDGMFVERPQGKCFFFTSPGVTGKNTCAETKYKNGFLIVDYEQDDGYVEVRRYYQNDNEEFVQDHNYGNDHGVWNMKIPITSIEPMSHSLFPRKRDEEFLTNDAIEKCIKELRNPNNSTVLLCALSGLGKTRILREAFVNDKANNSYFYCEFPSESSQLLTEFKKIMLTHRDEAGLIVLDNCPYQTLNDAVGCRDDHDSKFRIIGVNNEYYDIKNRLNDNIQIITLDQDQMRKMVNDYVDRHIPATNGDTAAQIGIKRLADGFPGMAVELVNKFKKEGKVNVHTIDCLVVKLLNLDKENDADKLKVLQSLALFQPFPYNNECEEAFRFIRENENLTQLFGKSPEEKRYLFRDVINRYDNSLIEITGSWLNVRPFPLALWLVRNWFETCDKERMEGIVTDLETWDSPLREKVVAGLCKRLEYMQDSVHAKDLIGRLTTGMYAPFCSEKVVCSDLGSRLFLAMSSVNPVAVASCLHNVLMPKTIEWVKEHIKGDTRRNLVLTLEKLCFAKESFNAGSEVLSLFAVAENEIWANNATEQLKQLFHILIPGTEASLQERIELLQYLKDSGAPYKNLALDCFDSALVSMHFSRFGSSSRFGLMNKKDYRPSQEEVREYLETTTNMLNTWLDEDESILKETEKIVTKRVVQWERSGILEIMFPLIEKICQMRGGKWGELYTALNNIEPYDPSIYSSGFLNRFEKFKLQIRPSTFCQRLKDARQIYYNAPNKSRSEDMEYKKNVSLPLAKDFLNDKIYLSIEEINEIAQDEEYADLWFTNTLHDMMADHQLEELLDVFIMVIDRNGGNEFKSPFVFNFCYVLRENAIVREFIQQIYQKGYIDLYINLLSKCETETLSSYIKVKQDIQCGRLGLNAVADYLQYALFLPLDQTKALIDMIRADFPTEVVPLMSFVTKHFDENLFDDERTLATIKQVILDYTIKDNLTKDDYYYARAVQYILKNRHDDVFATQLNKKLIAVLDAAFMANVLSEIYRDLVDDYTDAIWCDFESSFVSDPPSYFVFNIKHSLGSGYYFETSPLFEVAGERIKAMCKKHPNVAPARIAEMIPTFDKTKDEQCFSEWFMWMLDEFGNQKDVLQGLDCNLGTFAWGGSVIPLLERKRACFEKIKNHTRSEVRKWAKSNLNELKDAIDKERDQEEYERLSAD